jgi:stage III sporulation protein AG
LVNDTVTNTLQKLLENKKVQLLLALALVLLAFRLYTAPQPTPHTTPVQAARETAASAESAFGSVLEYRKSLEAQLALHLSHIAGAGQVTVMLTLTDGGKAEFAADREETRRSTDTTSEETLSQQTVLLQGGGRQSGLKLRETMPQVQGVVVIAGGARVAKVREMLTEAAATILALPPHRVTVLPGR